MYFIFVAENVLTSLGASHKRLTRTQFRVYIDQLTDKMSLMEFEEFSDYLTASVEVTEESSDAAAVDITVSKHL